MGREEDERRMERRTRRDERERERESADLFSYRSRTQNYLDENDEVLISGFGRRGKGSLGFLSLRKEDGRTS